MGRARSLVRVYVFYAITLALAGGIITRLVTLQIVNSANYKEQASAAQQYQKPLTPRRGEIFVHGKDQTLVSYAATKDWQNASMVPAIIEPEQRATVADQIAAAIGLSIDTVLSRMKPGDPYEPLKAKLTDAEIMAFQAIKNPALRIEKISGRFYPFNDLSAHVLGFVGYRDNERVGQYGVEEYYDAELRGQVGRASGEVDTRGQAIPFGINEFEPAVNGADLVLAIDPTIAREALNIITDLKQQYKATGAAALIMDPKTGAVRTMESVPSFDPNNYANVSTESVYLNPLTQVGYEPGSIMKPITMAAAIDLNKLTPDATYEDRGILHFGTRTIQNFDKKAHGVMTMTQVLEKSLNTGAVFAEQAMGNDNFKRYLEAFGFGERTNIDLSGEVAGNIKNLESGRDVNFATAAFGQGILVTPLQITRAFAALANGGNLMRPRLVERVVKAETVEIHEPEIQRKVIAQNTADAISKMLVSVMINGYDRHGTVPGYVLAGKTGTAQVPNPGGEGYSDETIHSFIGYGPVDNPRFVIFLKLDKPQGVNFASNSLAAPFSRLAKFLLDYYEIPPTEPVSHNP